MQNWSPPSPWLYPFRFIRVYRVDVWIVPDVYETWLLVSLALKEVSSRAGEYESDG